MNDSDHIKDFVVRYFYAISGHVKTPELCDQFMTDEKLKEHIVFFEAIFPKYEIYADEITCEGNRVVIRARTKGKHEGEFSGIPATHKEVEFPFAISYIIENNMIVNHWMIADQTILMQQLGIIES